MKHTIVISGAGSGLGRGLSEQLAAAGHQIIATDLKPESAEETAARIQSAGGAAKAFALDVRAEESVQAFWRELGDLPVSVLINNAGLQHVTPLEEFSTEKWDLLNEVMIRGTFLMCRAALPGMRERGFGRLVHIGSIHAMVASPGKAAYVTAKHALLGLSKVLALETADTDITSNTICPAYIHTPLVDAQIKDQARLRGISEEEVIEKVMLAPMPKKSFISIGEITATVQYLIHPLARNVTAQALALDGGWTAQ